MLIRSLASVLIVVSSFVLVTGQTPDAQRKAPDTAATTPNAMGTERLRDLRFPAGVSLQILIKELAKEMDINVLFDADSRLESRSVRIELKNVTAAAALNYILLQEGLISEEMGPRTIIVANRIRGTSFPLFGLGLTSLTPQLAQYFGVESGILIDNVRPNSPGSQAGLKAGDVIVGINGESVRGSLVLIRSISDKNESDIILNIVRDRKDQMVSVTRPNPSP